MDTILSINVSNYGSTGNIMRGISKVAEESGFECWQAYAPDKKNSAPLSRDIVIGTYNIRRANELYSKYTGMRGFQSFFTTKLFLKKIDSVKPDVIHLHNLHNNYIHVGLLFDYIKKNHIKVVWTLHDCWAFTGRCPYFQISKCERWKFGCHDCVYPKDEYPAVRRDKSDILWRKKKNAFAGVENMIIVTPSRWLANLVKESFLSEYPVKVINNGIDLEVFKPTESVFRERYCLKQDEIDPKYLIMGIAFNWENRKGIDVFLHLASELDERYRIVLVGTDEEVDKKLPPNIISIHHTSDQHELSDIYSAADVLVNPTREDNFPTVNIEALACGTPVITFETGGSAEMIDEHSGIEIKKDDFAGLMTAITNVCEGGILKPKDCIARSKDFDRYRKFQEYADLYKAL